MDIGFPVPNKHFCGGLSPTMLFKLAHAMDWSSMAKVRKYSYPMAKADIPKYSTLVVIQDVCTSEEVLDDATFKALPNEAEVPWQWLEAWDFRLQDVESMYNEDPSDPEEDWIILTSEQDINEFCGD